MAGAGRNIRHFGGGLRVAVFIGALLLRLIQLLAVPGAPHAARRRIRCWHRRTVGSDRAPSV